jgi:hypothetical protein
MRMPRRVMSPVTITSIPGTRGPHEFNIYVTEADADGFEHELEVLLLK